jgi:hypothetical protein
LIDEGNSDFHAQQPPQKKPKTLESIDEIMENVMEPDLDMESASQIVSFENQNGPPSELSSSSQNRSTPSLSASTDMASPVKFDESANMRSRLRKQRETIPIIDLTPMTSLIQAQVDYQREKDEMDRQEREKERQEREKDRQLERERMQLEAERSNKMLELLVATLTKNSSHV